MGKFTGSKTADKKVEQDMEVIVKEILIRVPRVIGIFLTGGFSRGEGPIKKIGKKFYPYNDYDIQVVVKNKIGKNKVDKIATEISQKLGYEGIKKVFYPFKKENQDIKKNFYIDLKVDSVTDLCGFLPRIRNYELKNHSMMLWGEDVRYLIPDFKLKDIPLSEGAKLLLDRMSQMIEYFSLEGKHEKECLCYFIQQAYAACVTSLLLLSRKYELGYLKSMKILKKTYEKDFPNLYSVIPYLADKIEQFIKWKVNPKKLPVKDVEKEWFVARKNIFEVSKYFFARFLKKKIRNERELAFGIYNMRKKFYLPYLRAVMKNKIGFDFGASWLLCFVSFVLKRKYYKRLREFGINKRGILFGKSPDVVIFASLIFLIGCIGEDGVDKEMLWKGRRILNKVYPVKGEGWEEVSLEYANAYIGFFMQKL